MGYMHLVSFLNQAEPSNLLSINSSNVFASVANAVLIKFRLLDQSNGNQHEMSAATEELTVFFRLLHQQANSPWSAESATWDLSAAQDCVLEDYTCEEFEILAKAKLPGKDLLRQRRTLLELLEANWDTG